MVKINNFLRNWRRIKWIAGVCAIIILGLGYTYYKNNNEDLFGGGRNEYAIPLAASKDELLKPININTADTNELQKLDGIGEVMAERIIEYRNENGPFGNIADIKNVKGIGDKTFEKLKDKITV